MPASHPDTLSVRQGSRYSHSMARTADGRRMAAGTVNDRAENALDARMPCPNALKATLRAAAG